MHEDVSTSPFLTQEERDVTTAALLADMTINEEAEPLSIKEVWSTFTSPQMIIMTPAFFANGTTGPSNQYTFNSSIPSAGCSLLGLGFFATSIVNSLGFSPGHSQLLTVPPYAAAFVASIITAWVSDRYKARGFTTMFAGLCMTIGYAIFIGTLNQHSVVNFVVHLHSVTRIDAQAHPLRFLVLHDHWWIHWGSFALRMDLEQRYAPLPSWNRPFPQ